MLNLPFSLKRVMKKFINEEFIKIDAAFQENCLDFYGSQSPLTEKEQKDYLQSYYDFFTKKYHGEVAFRKVVEDEKARTAANALGLEKNRSVGFAYKRKAFNQYLGWSLYTKRAKIEKDTVVLTDGYTFPVPCAKYEWDGGVSSVKFAFCVGKGYARKIHEGIKPTVTGRFIEFRKGCKEIINLMLSPEGILYQKDGSKKEYHYDFKKIGEFTFGSFHEVEIFFGKEGFTLRFGGREYALGYTANETPDTLFIGGGMQPTDEWQVRLIRLIDGKNEEKPFFVKNENLTARDEEYIGEVTLPYGVGTAENKDYDFIFRKKFKATAGKKTVLRLDGIDPCGEVFVNGEKALSVDTFDPVALDCTPFVKEGENDLEIVVHPRAPETLYPWHRHRDYYNAWFLGDLRIEECGVIVDEPLRVVTEKIEGNSVAFSVNLDTKLPAREGRNCQLLLRKIYPEQGEELLLESLAFEGGNLQRRYRLPVALWDTETPTLYEVTARLYEEGACVWTGKTQTGFRTVEQRRGKIYVNGERVVLKGALNMQFLPPYKEVPVNHLCPQDWQIVQMALAIKALGGNCLRLHQLGYGSSDRRFAEICDRLGVMLLWTTRLIDAVENVMWIDEWKQADAYCLHMKQVVNNPSIIMWEGSNELHSDLRHIDLVYDQFVTAVKKVDTTRLICPISHVYYGGGIYECGCQYYNTFGTEDESGNPAQSSYGWKDKDVVRSAHTYCILLGYGSSWRDMATQNWRLQNELFHEEEKAYIVSEFAVIGRQNPETKEAQAFINKDSYELDDEYFALGYRFADEEWRLSQAFQALCTAVSIKQLLKNDADGMLWCCLQSGANNASYLKPIIDFEGYAKVAFYEMREKFQDTLCFNEEVDVLYPQNYEIKPVVYGVEEGKEYGVTVEIVGEQGVAAQKRYRFTAKSSLQRLDGFVLPRVDDGYYTVRYTVEERE